MDLFQFLPNPLLVIGTGGMVLQSFNEILALGWNPIFYNDQQNINKFLNRKVINSEEEIKSFKIKHFAICVGNPLTRYNLTQKFLKLKLKEVQIINDDFPYTCEIEQNTIILKHCIIEHNVKIGYGSLINVNNTICHDSKIGKYVEIAPSCTLLGNVEISDFCFIGAGSILHPNIRIAKGVKIGAGSIIREDIDDENATVYTEFKNVIKKY